MASRYGGRVRFVSENYGESALAKRFGVRRYPAIFVDDVLVATPKDFGFYGSGEGADGGRYAPLREAASHERLRADLARMIELSLAGRGDLARAATAAQGTGEAGARADGGPERLPRFALGAYDGGTIASDSLGGRVVLVEFWATWCPPCRGTLRWLGDLKRRFGDRVEVVALAIESDEADARRIAAQAGAPLRWGTGSPEIARAFGDLGAVPTLFVFDRERRIAGRFFGAPPGLHAEAEALVARLLAPR